MLNESISTLDSGLFEVANLLTIKFIPLFSIELYIKWSYEACVDEVHESVTYITLILKIYRQVEEVVSFFMVPVDFL